MKKLWKTVWEAASSDSKFHLQLQRTQMMQQSFKVSPHSPSLFHSLPLSLYLSLSISLSLCVLQLIHYSCNSIPASSARAMHHFGAKDNVMFACHFRLLSSRKREGRERGRLADRQKRKYTPLANWPTLPPIPEPSPSPRDCSELRFHCQKETAHYNCSYR